MTQKDKQLLLVDLCARLPYGVKLQKFNEPDSVFELYSVNKESGEIMFYKYKGKTLTIGDVGKLYRRNVLLYKPYLRPMSSMTEIEKMDFNELQRYNVFYSTKGHYTEVDWLNAHHFDYRGLIEKGLALEVPEGMYDI